MKKFHPHLLTAITTATLVLSTLSFPASAANDNAPQAQTNAPGSNPNGPPPGDSPGAPPGAPPGGPPPDGAGGPPGGPGALGGPGGEEIAAEPLVTKAQSSFADYNSLQHAAAVTTITDFGLLDACKLDDGKAGFCPTRTVSLGELALAVTKATRLVRGALPQDVMAYALKQGWLPAHAKASQTATGRDAARALLRALGVKTLSGNAAIDASANEHGLNENLSEDLSTPLTRDALAQWLANALRHSDGKGLVPVTHHNDAINVASGTRVIDNTRVFQFGASAIQDAGESVLVVRNSRIDGDSSAPTRSLSGNPAGLLIAGSIRTTLALNQSQAFYFNSSITSKDWAALSTDGAVPITQEGQKELSLYSYGSRVKTLDGGYGVYSDLFCNAYVYGSAVQAAEVGVISGTYGQITLGTIGDGEANPSVAQQLVAADRQSQANKQLGSRIMAGRNALMIHSVSLPPYWGFKGYSQKELPLHSARIRIHGGSLGTNLALDKHAEYTAERQAFIKHVAGSVILVRSTNADLDLDGVKLTAGQGGTGALIHTVINNDTRFMVKVPDGETYPGTRVRMKSMRLAGDILNEDYQRDLMLDLASTRLDGRITSGTADDWNQAARQGGFSAYIIDADGYRTAHGVKLVLDARSSWTVTARSTLQGLTLAKGARLMAPQGKTLTMRVNGVNTAIRPGSYLGRIELSAS